MSRIVTFVCVLLLLVGYCLVSSGQAEPERAAIARKTSYSWRQTDSSLALLNHGRIVWQLNFNKKEGKPYFHPVGLTDGTVLTWLRPADHRWHRALWFSWKYINGLNYWEEDPKTGLSAGRTEMVSVWVSKRADYSAHIEMTLRYHPPSERALFQEKRTITVTTPDDDGRYRIDWWSVFFAVGGDVLLERTPIPGEKNGKGWGGYAGLSVRMAKATRGWEFVNSEDRKDKQAHGKKARWMSFSGELPDGKEAGIAIFEDPSNLRHPTPWYVEKGMPYFSPAVLFDKPYKLASGKILELRYRILIHPGRADKETLENEWKAFSGLEDQTERFNKPIFDIYLGEPLGDLKERFRVRPEAVDSANWRRPSRRYRVDHSDDSIDYCSVEIFENKVLSMHAHFVDGSKEHFKVLEKQLQKDFGKPEIPPYFDYIRRYTASVDSVGVKVALQGCYGITVNAVHLPLQKQRSDQVLQAGIERQHKKRQKLKSQQKVR